MGERHRIVVKDQLDCLFTVKTGLGNSLWLVDIHGHGRERLKGDGCNEFKNNGNIWIRN